MDVAALAPAGVEVVHRREEVAEEALGDEEALVEDTAEADMEVEE